MNMCGERLTPRVQRSEHAGRSTQVLRIGEQFLQGAGGRCEQRRRKRLAIESPQRVQIVGNGKDDVVVRASEQALRPTIEPLFACKQSALRTTSMSTRVVDDALLVALGAANDMPTERHRTTRQDVVGGVPHVFGKPCRLGKPRERTTKDVLHQNAQDSPHHENATFPVPTASATCFLPDGPGENKCLGAFLPDWR